MIKNLNEQIGWTLIDYDRSEFPFDKIIENNLLEYLHLEFNTKIDRLEDLHLNKNVLQNLENIRQKMFSIFRDQEFQICYKSFAKHLIDIYSDKKALIQITPTARIQPPHFMTTSFHSDAWYGHSQSTNSFWLPVTELSEDNTLNMAPSRDVSDVTMEKLLKGSYSLQEINDICMKVTKPSEAIKGQILSFGPDMIHGAKMNTSDQTRVSFDFRIVNSDNDLGYKPISNYYRYDELINLKTEKLNVDKAKNTKNVFLSYSNSCSGVNPKSQLMLCNNVAKDKGLAIQRNESEIYVFDHLPVLRHYLGAETPSFDGVVVFSVGIFNGQRVLAEEILNLAKKNSKMIVFAAEDIIFNQSVNNQQILDRII
jgi:ectoine hydroxylase-related dioxygenase (phytanoyl-CoA dioxygenase family)